MSDYRELPVRQEIQPVVRAIEAALRFDGFLDALDPDLDYEDTAIVVAESLHPVHVRGEVWSIRIDPAGSSSSEDDPSASAS